MNRLQKKCFIAATGLHLLLVVILFVGPAFLLSHKGDNLPPVDFIPSATVDALISGGGSPTAQPTPPTPAPPAPQPAPQVSVPPPQPKPEPVKEVVKAEPVKEVAKPEPPKINKPDPEALEIPKDRKRKIEVNTTIVKRNANDVKAAANAKAAADAAKAKEIAAAKQRAAQISQAIAGLKGDLSPTTQIDFGPGGGGPVYANFYAALKSIYDRAWIVPQGVTEKDDTVSVSVTIARDGTVVSVRITRPSGNKAVDRSVQEMLDRVKFAVPLPKDAPEDQRTVPFKLNVEAKLAG